MSHLTGANELKKTTSFLSHMDNLIPDDNQAISGVSTARKIHGHKLLFVEYALYLQRINSHCNWDILGTVISSAFLVPQTVSIKPRHIDLIPEYQIQESKHESEPSPEDVSQSPQHGYSRH